MATRNQSAKDETTRTEEEIEQVLDAPKVQLGQSDIDEQNDKQEAVDREIVNRALEEKAVADEEAAKLRATAVKKGQEALARRTEASKAPAPTVVARFFLADPLRQVRIYRKGTAYPLRFRNGTLAVQSEEDAELVRSALGGEVFEQDFPDDKPAPACETCGYAPRSYAAFAAHQAMHPTMK